jgi:uncharacterized repeat protein (TIGR03803 family)
MDFRSKFTGFSSKLRKRNKLCQNRFFLAESDNQSIIAGLCQFTARMGLVQSGANRGRERSVIRKRRRGNCLNSLGSIALLAAPAGAILAGSQAQAQQFDLLHSFSTSANDGSLLNSSGELPGGSLVVSGSTIYGMTYAGGKNGYGTIFDLSTSGSNFGLLHSFADTLTDGAFPEGQLIESGTLLFGMTTNGGAANPLSVSPGMIFEISTSGSGFSPLHVFTPSTDGDYPFGELVQSGSTLYGMTEQGGSGTLGTIFGINTSGSNFTVEHAFTGQNVPNPPASDGANPYGSLVQDGSDFFGMTEHGGAHNFGTLFEYSPTAGETVLHSFSYPDGVWPQGSLILSGNTLYGMTMLGGTDHDGTIFKINTDGSGFQVIHTFSGGGVDGAVPSDSLTISGSTLYGMTESGGQNNDGTVFDLNTDGTGFGLLHSFSTAPTDGDVPQGSLTMSGETLYGMTELGGANQLGSIFSLTPATVNGVWSSAGGGSWGVSGNWSGNSMPVRAGDSATFGSAITAPSTVTLDGAWTVGSVIFNNSNSYTVAAGTDPLGNAGSLNLDNGSADASVTDSGGTHSITAPVILTSNVTLTVVNSSDSLQLTGPISGVGSVTTNGNGTVTLGGINTYAGVTTAASGSLIISAAGALPSGSNLTIGTNSTSATTTLASGIGLTQLSALTVNPGSTLDIRNNEVLINYGSGPDPISAIAADLQSGFNGGAWNGAGIDSSAVASANATGRLLYGIGYADGADGIIPGLSSGEIEILPTLAGDAKLQGSVNFGDFELVSQYYGQAASWDEGNFGYGSVVDFGDFEVLAENFGGANALTTGELAGLEQFAAQNGVSLVQTPSGFSLVSVPEPASLGMMVLAGLGIVRRRRRGR